MEIKSSEAVEIDIKELLFVLIHKLWIIVVVGILGAVGVGAVSIYLLEPMYTSTTKVYVINRQEENKMTLSDLQSGTQLTKDYMILVKSRPVIEQVIRELDWNITNKELSKMIKVNAPVDTRILEIEVNYNDAYKAKQLADAIARISSERMVSVMEIEKVNIMEQGNIPIEPSSPNITKNIIFGGLLGVILSSFIIIIRHLMNDSIRTSEDIEKYLGLTTLSSIPLEEDRNKKKSKNKPSKNKTAIAS